MNIQSKIHNDLDTENFRRMKALGLVFIFVGIFTLITDYSSFNPWDEAIIEIYKTLDIVYTSISILLVVYFWRAQTADVKVNSLVVKLAVVFVVLWAVLICGIDYSTSGFSTYIAALLLTLLYLHFKPVFFIPLIWISTMLLLGIMYLSPNSKSEFVQTVLVLTPISLITTLISYRFYKEKTRSLENFYRNQELTNELKEARDNLNVEVEKKTRNLIDANIELSKAKEKAEESNLLKSAFLSNLSHEIRTPMNGILGFLSLLDDKDLTEQNRERYIEIMNDSGERLLNTINDIIDISRIDSNETKITIDRVNVSEMLKSLSDFFQIECAGKSIELLVEKGIPEPQLMIQSDEVKLNSIFTNLIKNAIKYTHSGKIFIGVNKQNDMLEFQISDTGIGIAKSQQLTIFDRFVRADIENKTASQGSGLGLAITKSYVEMLGGKIWLESELGKGSTFYFTIPSVVNDA